LTFYARSASDLTAQSQTQAKTRKDGKAHVKGTRRVAGVSVCGEAEGGVSATQVIFLVCMCVLLLSLYLFAKVALQDNTQMSNASVSAGSNAAQVMANVSNEL